MDKEKLFNDMKAIIMENEYDYEDGDAGDIANALIDAGYRKADEVQKETAKKLLKQIDERCLGCTKSLTNPLRREWGVEVDE